MFPADGIPPHPDWFTADAAQGLARARAIAAARTADLFLPPDSRWREDDRALVATMLAGLVDGVERVLRRHVAPALGDHPAAVALAAPDPAIARPILNRAGALRDAALVTVLGEQAAARRLTARLTRAALLAREVEPEPVVPLTTELALDADPAVMAAARALASEPEALLPAEIQHRLVWRVAAALRNHLVATHGLSAAAVDPPIARAAEAALAGYDEGATPVGRVLTLARALAAAGRLDGALAPRAVAAGEPLLAAAILSLRAAIGFSAAWAMMTDPDPARLLLLCRAAGLDGDVAADIALRLATDDDDEALATRIEAYAGLAPERAAAAIGLWRCDPAYIESIVELRAGPPA